MCRSYIKLLISENKIRVLDIDVLLIKESITDGRRLVLYYTGILPFYTADSLKTIQNCG